MTVATGVTEGPLSGAFLPNGKTSLPEIWRILHSNARLEFELAVDDPKGLRAMLNSANNELLKLLETCPIERWRLLCEGAGWTEIAAAALSWCDGANEQHLVNAWNSIGATIMPTAVFAQSARLVHINFIETGTTLTDLMTRTVGRPLAFALSCVRASGSIQDDWTSSNREALSFPNSAFADIACRGGYA